MSETRRILGITTCALILGCTLLLSRCTGEGGGVATTGGSEVVVKLIDPEGSPVKNATVRLFRSLDSVSTPQAIDSVTTNEDGQYVFTEVPADTYSIYGTNETENLVVMVASVIHDTGRTDLGTRTMHAPGKISGTLAFDKADRSGAICYIPGTSMIAVTDQNGTFVIENVPPGRVFLACAVHGYLPYRDSVVVESGSTSSLGQLSLSLDPALPPPAPTGVSAFYDTLTGTAIIHWNPVSVSDIDGYRVYTDTGSASAVLSATVRDTFFVHQVFTDLNETNSARFWYRIKSFDKNKDESVTFSDPVSVEAVSPQLVTTSFSWSTHSSSDSLFAKEAIGIRLAYHNPTRPCSLLTWIIEGVQARQTPLDSCSGVDTLVYVWPDTGSKRIYARIHDKSGYVWQDSVRLLLGRSAIVPRNTWVSDSSMLRARRTAASTVLNNKLYITGGEFDRYNGLGDFDRVAIPHAECYDFSRKTWYEIASMQTSRFAHTLSAANGKMYVIGGDNGAQMFRTIEEYDPSRNRWQTIGGIPAPRAAHAAVTIDNIIYIVGGFVFENNSREMSSEVFRLDPATQSWEFVGRLNTPRAFHQAVAHSGQIIVMGGLTEDSRFLQRTITASVEVFDLKTGRSVNTTPMSQPRSNFSAGLIGGRIIVVGGLGSIFGGDSVLDGVEEYNPNTEVWDTSKLPMTTGRHATSAVTFAGGLYVAGGAFTGYTENNGVISETDILEIFYP